MIADLFASSSLEFQNRVAVRGQREGKEKKDKDWTEREEREEEEKRSKEREEKNRRERVFSSFSDFLVQGIKCQKSNHTKSISSFHNNLTTNFRKW